VAKLNYYSNKDNLIDIKWKNIKNIESIRIGNNVFKSKIDNDKLYFLIKKNIIKEWTYEIEVNLKNWKNITLKNKLIFNRYSSTLKIDQITPKKIKNDIARNIILQWKWFSKTISIQLSNNIVLTETSFNIISDNVLAVIIPAKLKEWLYELNIMSTTGIYNSNININIIK
jgi:hypothetical protein